MNRVFMSIFGINIYWYSVTMLLAILTGIYVISKESKRIGQYEFTQNIIFSVIILGIIGARLYYVIFNFNYYKNDLLSIFKIWEGGLAIYGAIISGFFTVLYYCIKNKKNIIEITDMIVPGLIIAQAIGRWGNFFNQEAYGRSVSLVFLEKIHLPRFIINGMYIDGVYYHPTFLYESIWCVLGFVLLLILRKITNRRVGVCTYSYFVWYGIGRSIIEGLRTDSLYLGSFRVSQVLSIILVIIGIIGLVKGRIRKNERKI